MTEQDAYERAKRRAKTKYEFYNHLIVYLVVNAFLIAVNLVTSPQSYWFVFPLIGWGVAIVIHATKVFLLPDEARMIERLTEGELRKQKSHQA
ncbi:MAG: 2TM domain-containing protein [Burkholderiales bacterium]|nr:MAG: 2TM domain-containing protein [Burkholderiales bacterium]